MENDTEGSKPGQFAAERRQSLSATLYGNSLRPLRSLRLSLLNVWEMEKAQPQRARPARAVADAQSSRKNHQRMQTARSSSAFSAILHQRCPRCRSGRIFRYSIFRGFPKMCERCSVCDLKFQREEGYFLGAMYISFGLALAAIAVIAVLLWMATGWWITKVTIWAVVLFLPLAP